MNIEKEIEEAVNNNNNNNNKDSSSESLNKKNDDLISLVLKNVGMNLYQYENLYYWSKK